MSGLKTMTMLAVALSVAAWSASAGVTVSKSAPRYFEKDGRGWIPTGVNICFARNVETKGVMAARAEFEGWIASFAGYVFGVVCLILGIVRAASGEMIPLPLIGKLKILN